VRRRSGLAVVVAAGVLAGCTGGDDDAADDVDSPAATLSAPETFPASPVDATIPSDTLAGESNGAVDDVLADGTITSEELAASYETYVECLVEGGGSGRYAYDIDLRTGLVIGWNLDGDDDDGVDRDLLSAGCSRQHLGELTWQFGAANPPSDDLAARQRASIAACIEAVSPAAAANLPAEISVGTGGDASSLSELQLDPAALDPASLGADAEDVAAVSGCIASVGSEWRAFG
jgi:hypothetical protein